MSVSNTVKPVQLQYKHFIPDQWDTELPPIIFVHGLFATKATWHNIIRRIVNDTKRQAYAIDLRNHGDSEWSDVFDLEALAADLENFLIMKNIQKPILVGHSMGGKCILQLALQKPTILSKVIIVESRLGDITKEEINTLNMMLVSFKRIKLLKNISEADAGRIILNLVKEFYPTATTLDRDKLYVPVHTDANGKLKFEFNIDVLEKLMQNASTVNLDWKTCKIFHGPALFLSGGSSPMEVDPQEKVLEYFPNAQFSTIEKGKHIIHLEFPDEFVAHVTNFINN